MDISMDIHEKSVDMDMDMDVIFHIHGNPAIFNTPAEGVPRGIVCRRRGLNKVESWCFQSVENFFR